MDVKDETGNLISVDNNATVFFGGLGDETTEQATEETQATEEDVVAPEDVTKLVAKMVKKLIVTLSWKASMDTAGDLAQYVLYQSTDGKTYDKGVVVKKDAESFDIASLVPGMKYFFKLTAKDETGNESKGVVTTFVLPETGPELGFLLLGSFGLGKIVQRKKKTLKK